LIMLVSSIFFYQRIYRSSLAESERSVQQLLETVSATAAIAAYVGNSELAEQVVSGLTKNDIVEGAEILAGGKAIGSKGKKIDRAWPFVRLQLKAPFDANEIVGELSVVTNLPLIAKRARDSALVTTMSLAAQAAVVAILVLILVYWMMTRPLSSLSNRLHNIIPGDGKRLNVLKQHRSDEIGLLVNDINSLLGTVEKMLKEERQLRHRVELLEHRFRGIFEDSSAGIFLVREDGTLVTANPAFFKLTGKTEGMDAIASNTNIVRETFFEPDQARALIKLAIVSQRPCSWDLQISAHRGEANRWVHCIFSPAGEDKKNPVVEGVMYDITQRKLAEEHNRELAEKDSLTGLANRQAAESTLKELSHHALYHEASFVVMLIDLDRFKYINDTYGHDAGDWVLKVVADRLRKRVRASDLVARLGGDEFLIVINQTNNREKVKEIAEKLLADQRQPMEVQPGFFETHEYRNSIF
jgi:diguanylate cyclase (GGDEF)-like protein/PAS domain S-box-containing protein